MRFAAGALGGLILAGASTRPAPLLALALLALTLAGRRGLLAACAVGLLAGWWRPAPAPPVAGLPVTVSGTLERPWSASEDGWSAVLRVQHYRQGHRVELWSERVRLSAAAGPPPDTGRGLRARGLLRRAPGLANRPPLPTGPWRLRLKSRRFLEPDLLQEDDLWWRAGLKVRRRIEIGLAASGDGPGIRLARALVLGEASCLRPRWRRGLRAAGLAHLVALSGLHVGLLAGICLLGGAALPRGVGPVVAAVAAVGFLLVAGGRPALLRATAMGVLAAGALVLGRRPNGASLLAVLAAALALPDPRLIDDLGYRLTCAATAGILGLAPRFERRWVVLPRWLRRPLAMTCGAQLASLPWSLPAFHLLTPLAALWNLAAVPWTALALAGCLCLAAVAGIWPAAAGLAVSLVNLLAWPFAAVGALPPSVLRPLPVLLAPWQAALLAAGLCFVLLRPGRRWPLALVALGAHWLSAPSAPPPELRLLDVGQGEAVLLRDGDAAVLVDGGGWRYGDIGGRVILPALAAAGVRRLQAVVLTHPDLDHCRGLTDLTSYLPVGEVWMGPGWRSSSCAGELRAAAGADLRLLWSGERAEVGRWRLLALHPEPGTRGRGNDRSLVLAATAPGLRVLLTGDITATAERRLLRRWPAAILRADILKVAHHGSATSTTAGLLAGVEPRLALISCGVRNHYGHPSAKVVRQLDAAGVRTLRTDRSGEIVIRRGAHGRWRLSTPGVPRPG